jgi:type IV secretory pathway TraG/TraD family ATPase VirD4
LNSLEPVLSRGRGYGACFVGGIQDVHQLRDIYGDKGAEVLISSFGTSLFFYQNNNRSAEWAAQQLGSAEFLENREGLSFGAHETRDGVNVNSFTKEQRLVLGSEIKNLKKREAFMTTAGDWPVTKLSFNYQERQGKEPALIPRNIADISHQLIKNIDGSLEKLNRDSETKKLVTEEINRTEEEAMELF